MRGFFSSCSDDFLGETETTDLDQATVFADSTYTADFLNQIYVDIGFDIQHNRYKDQYNDHGGLQTSCDEAAYKASTGLTTDVMFATGTVILLLFLRTMFGELHIEIFVE